MANAHLVFKDYCPDIALKLEKAARNWLEEGAGELEAQAMRNTRVNTGKTKGSWNHKVNVGSLEATVGSDYENAIWEEFGTGVYAENGGRTDVPWHYQAEDGNWYSTKGKRGTRAFRKAYNTMRPKLKKAARDKFKQVLG